MQFVFEQIRCGGDRNFAYLIGDRDGGEAVVVDPSYTPGEVVQRATDQGLRVSHIINTHGHGDHTNGNAEAQRLSGAAVLAWHASRLGPDVGVADGDELEVGAYRLRFLHTPGHTTDHLVVELCDMSVALTGDLLFVGKVGGTTTEAEAIREWETLQRLIRRWPEQMTIWPGHDYGCRPATTIGLEKRCNPFLLCADFAAFARLKSEWAAFKAQHGLK